MKLEIEKLNRKTIKLLPERDWNIVSEYKAIFLVPSGLKHESGYMTIAIIGQKENGDFEVCAYPDDIDWDFTGFVQKFSCTGMRTDCYYPNGILRFWGRNLVFEVGESFSSTDIKIKNKVENGLIKKVA